MIYPLFSEFKKKAKQGNLIPVYEEIVSDLETPVSSFFKIGKTKYSFLLESIEGGEQIARYSFLANNPFLIFKSKNKEVEIITNGKKEKIICSNPILKLKEILDQYKLVKDENLPDFIGGAVGYIGYDNVRLFEKIPDKNKKEIDAPDSMFLLIDTILIFDHLKHKIKIVANAYTKNGLKKSYELAKQKIDEIKKSLNKPLKIKKSFSDSKLSYTSNFTKEKFENIVNKSKEYIKSGDIIQTVLSQRLEIDLDCDPFEIYRALRTINPSPYMFYLNLDEIKIVGSSPELLIKSENGIVESRPIAGTRPRGNNEQEDGKLAQELLSDEKEKAEHIMLVDLARNDLGRICDYGSVKIEKLMFVEKYSHVMHIVSSVKGKLKKGLSSYDILAASFPAGTVSGAPKIRAMEIIDELENVKRGIYAGAIGYLSFSGEINTCIAIRTLVIKNGKGFVQSGAGIVADSNSEKEYFETLNKAKVILKAIELAKKGF